jgi:hypothetical protein
MIHNKDKTVHLRTAFQETYQGFPLSKFSPYHRPVSDLTMRPVPVSRRLFSGLPELVYPPGLYATLT